MRLQLAMPEWKMQCDAGMGVGPGAIVCCGATAVPCAAAPASGGRLREMGCLILQVAVFLLMMLSIVQVPGDQLELKVFSAFQCSGWAC